MINNVVKKEFEEAIDFAIKKYLLDPQRTRFVFLAFNDIRQKELVDTVKVGKMTSDFSGLRSFLIRQGIIESNVSEKVRGIIQEITPHLVGAYENLKIGNRTNRSLKDFVSMFISTVEDNLELTYNRVTLVDEMLSIYTNTRLNWRDKMSKYLNALQVRTLLDEKIIEDIIKHLT